MKTSADIGLVANVLATKFFVNGDTAWSIAGEIVETLDTAGRLAPTVTQHRCDDCGRTYLGTGHLCPTCRRHEDGPYRQPLDDEAFAALCATGYADDEAVF